MKRRIKLLIPVAVIVILAAGTVTYYNHPFPDDYMTFIGMREDLTKMLNGDGAQERDISKQFTNYKLKLNPLYSFMFKTRELSLYLKSFKSDLIETATINQLEIGVNSGTFFDFTFMIRPKTDYSLPFFHGDALKALPGVDGALYMDFYSFDNTMEIESFFGENISKLKEAQKLAAPYWKNEGFGELTPHLDPYKSPYRFEITEPEKASETERREYFKTAHECFLLYTEAYLDSLKTHTETLDDTESMLNMKHIKDFVGILYEHDVAVKMGKMIFPEEDFDKYFLNGFWGVE